MLHDAIQEEHPILLLVVALALGLLIGIERGWKERDTPEGRRTAGIRTFGLIGLLGGLGGLLGEAFGALALGLVFITVAATVMVARRQALPSSRDLGLTTEIAALVTFVLGALATHGEIAVAAAGAVATVALLSLKPLLHGWLRRTEERDLFAGIKLLLISVIILPVLPDRGYGPWQALNPYEIWLMVVLIASLSFAGYLAVKLTGARHGILLTGLFGGLVSSTATTLTLAHFARDHRTHALPAAGIVLASAVMLPRMLVLVVALNPGLLTGLLVPAGMMLLVLGSAAAWLTRGSHDAEPVTGPKLHNPLELRTALVFGLILAAVMLAASALHAWLGEKGVYLAAAFAGIADVDAITVSLARLAVGADGITPLQQGIIIAAVSNTLFKGALASAIAGRGLAVRVLPAMLAAAAAGIAGALLLIG